MDAVSVASLRYIEKQLIARQLPVGDKTAESLRLLPKETRREIRKEAKRIAEADVFGADHKRDKDGNPIEQGIGSPSNMTPNAIDAYVANQTDRKRRGDAPAEDGYTEHLKRMKADLATCQAKRKAQRAAEDADDD